MAHQNDGLTDGSDDDDNTGSVTVAFVDYVEIVHEEDPLNSDEDADKPSSPDTVVACTKCGKCMAQKHLKRHSKTHTDKKQHKCKVCGKEFFRIEHFRRHQLTHTGIKHFQCDLCDKSFSRSDNLTKHRRTHTDERLYDCEVCVKSFRRSDHMAKHMLSQGHLRNTIEQPEHRQQSKTAATENDIGGSKVATKKRISLTESRQRGTAPTKKDKTTDADDYISTMFETKCNDDLFKEKLDEDAEGKAKQTFFCDLCDKMFVNRSCLTKHRATKSHLRHEEEQQVEYLDDTADVPEPVVTLDEDIELTTDKRKFLCGLCAKAFLRASHLSRHLLTRSHLRNAGLLDDGVADTVDHTMAENGKDGDVDDKVERKRRLFSCDACVKSFPYKSALTKHLLTASHLRNATQIEYLNESDDGSDELDVDEATVENVTEEDDGDDEISKKVKAKTHSCDMCAKTFGNQGGLIRHQTSFAHLRNAQSIGIFVEVDCE